MDGAAAENHARYTTGFRSWLSPISDTCKKLICPFSSTTIEPRNRTPPRGFQRKRKNAAHLDPMAGSFESTMAPASQSMKPAAVSKISRRRLAREWKTVSAMLRIYCRDQHHGGLCPQCQELMTYVRLRLDRCRFGEDKPTCAKCPVHCYQKDRRDQIKTVMRYAGPRMVWEHPLLSLQHLMDGWLRRPDRGQNPTKLTIEKESSASLSIEKPEIPFH